MTHANLIGGQWLESGEVVSNLNPSDTRDVIGDYARASAADVHSSIDAARQAGVDAVMARSAFTQQLADILRLA